MKLVISQYMESVDWAAPYDHVVIKKGVDMPNVGREASSYLLYILTHYSELAGDYVFLQDWPFDHAPNILAELESKRYYGDEIRPPAAPGSPFYNRDEVHRVSSMLNLPLFDEYKFISGAQFKVSAEDIRRRPVQWYATALAISLSHPFAPWIFEQLWPVIFPLGEISQDYASAHVTIPREVNGETTTCRDRLACFCTGNGVDLGFGGDPIVSHAICVDRSGGHLCRSNKFSPFKTHLVGDIANLHWFQNGSLDWVYSSHALEDFQSTEAILGEWLRVLKPGGHLILFCPDQKAYEQCCREANTEPNAAHVHKDFSLDFVKQKLKNIGIPESAIVHALWPVPNNPYSFDLVVKKPA